MPEESLDSWNESFKILREMMEEPDDKNANYKAIFKEK